MQRLHADKAVAYGMNPDKTVVFPWGVDLEHFLRHTVTVHRPSSRTLLQSLLGTPLRRGCSCARLCESGAGKRDVNLLLLAAGRRDMSFVRYLQNGGVLDRVAFAGQISQTVLPDWYHRADLYISPSHVDGSSVSLMEALACGLPCLVSDIPANKEWVTEGENGWLFRDGDANHLAEKILAAIAQREKSAQGWAIQPTGPRRCVRTGRRMPRC